MEILGPISYLRAGSPEALLRGRMERSYQGILVLTFGGGHERDPAGHHRHARPRHAPGAPLMAGLPSALDFSGKRVVVTGAASGIGAATADLFAGLGADVVGLDVADGSLDLRSPEAIDAAVAALQGTPIWALVNCAGVPADRRRGDGADRQLPRHPLPDRRAPAPDRRGRRRRHRGLAGRAGLARAPRPARRAAGHADLRGRRGLGQGQRRGHGRPVLLLEGGGHPLDPAPGPGPAAGPRRAHEHGQPGPGRLADDARVPRGHGRGHPRVDRPRGHRPHGPTRRDGPAPRLPLRPGRLVRVRASTSSPTPASRPTWTRARSTSRASAVERARGRPGHGRQPRHRQGDGHRAGGQGLRRRPRGPDGARGRGSGRRPARRRAAARQPGGDGRRDRGPRRAGPARAHGPARAVVADPRRDHGASTPGVASTCW